MSWEDFLNDGNSWDVKRVGATKTILNEDCELQFLGSSNELKELACATGHFNCPLILAQPIIYLSAVNAVYFVIVTTKGEEIVGRISFVSGTPNRIHCDEQFGPEIVEAWTAEDDGDVIGGSNPP